MNLHVLIVDRCPVVVSGLRTLLTGIAKKIEEAHTGYEAIRLAETLRPTLLILDCSLDDIPSLEVVGQIRQLRHPPHILIYSYQGDPQCFYPMKAAGVTGFLLRTEPREKVICAVETVAKGSPWFSAEMLNEPSLAHAFDDNNPPLLTPRERTVYQGLLEGKSNAAIAAQCQIKEQVVKNYFYRIYKKLGVSSRAEAILKARGTGLVTLAPGMFEQN